jgi:predicted DNA-binding protein with PD1-like motif
MQAKVLNQQGDQRTIAIVFDKGDEFIAGLKGFAQQESLVGSHFTAIGAFSDVVLEFFDRQKLDYKEIPVREQVEVLSLVGNIALDRGKPKVHAHVVLGRSDGAALGGHIKEAHVWPTLEVIVVEEPNYLRRRTDPETGLALIDFEPTAEPEAVSGVREVR